MTTQMQMAELRLVADGHPRAQRVAVLHRPGEIALAWAEIPEPGDGEIRVKN